jgi:hypothetical protein
LSRNTLEEPTEKEYQGYLFHISKICGKCKITIFEISQSKVLKRILNLFVL